MRKCLKLLLLLLALVFPAPFLHASDLIAKAGEGYEVQGNRILYRRGNAGMVLEPATPELIRQFYIDRGASMDNPLQLMPPEVQTATMFLLTLLNRTNGDLTYTPRYTALRIKTEAYFPLDFTVLLGLMEDLDKDTRKLVEKSIFHSPVMIPAGRIVTRLLIFPALPKKYNELRIEFDYLYFENMEIRTSFRFERKKKDGKGN